MVRLCCAAVGMGDVFSVEFKINDHVSKLKEAITAASELENDQWFQLGLYLAKKDNGHGAWLTEEQAADVRYGKVSKEFMKIMRRLTDYECFGETFQPGEGQVHVLVLYPTDLGHIAMNDDYPQVISSYVEVAGRLRKTEEVKALSSHLANMMVEKDASTPFVVLENSSGTGKTQMAFNLQVLGECEVFYIVCAGCVFHSSRFTWERHRDRNSFTRRRLAELARRKERGAKPFVFYLDEFPRARRLKSPFDDDEEVNPLKDAENQLQLENKLRLTRNVFLSFGLTVVTSSTNGSGKNLFVNSSHSRGGDPSLWCVVFPSLPRVNITIDADIPVLLTEIIKHSRPLFAEIALKYVQEHPYNGSIDICSYLNEMAGDLASQFRRLKGLSNEVKIAQLNLLLGSSCHVQDDKVDIIDSHFARLPELSAFELYLNANGLWKDNSPWTCRAVSPSPSEDLLLHLTMTGGPSFRPLSKNKPLCRVMSKIQAPFYYDKNDKRSSEAIRLEELTTGAIVLASHAQGFGGVAFPKFLGEFLYELGVSKDNEKLQDVESAGWTQIVPFLAPPTAEWPEWLNDSSMSFGHLIRTRSNDHIELQTSSNSIYGEREENNSGAGCGVTKCIQMCVPEGPMVHFVLMNPLRKRDATGELVAESVIHLVVANSLQKECFPGELSWGTFVREQRLQNVDFYRISERSTLQEIEGMTNQRSGLAPMNDKKLVIFIELRKK